MKQLLFIFIAALTISSCTVTRQRCNELYPPVETHTSDTVLLVHETVVHDTIEVPADSSALELFFKADTLYNIVVIDSVVKRGQHSSIGWRTERNNKVLHAVFDCKCDSLAIYRTYLTRDTSLRVNNKETKIATVEVPARLTWWQQFKIDYGGYAMGFIAAWVLFIIIRLALKIYGVATPQGAVVSAGSSLIGWILKLFRK